MTGCDGRTPVRRLGRFLLLPLVLALAGCGKGQATVSGKVAFNGQPLPSGTVAFLGEDGRAYTGVIGADGTYTLEKVSPGPMKISVQTPPPPSGKPVVQPPPGASSMPGMDMRNREVKTVAIPRKYEDPNTSGLTYTVTSGSQTHDIELK